MKKFPFWLFSLLVFCVFACNKTNDVHPQRPGGSDSSDNQNGGVAYNKSDTSISLQNGRISLNVPAGAMKEGTQVSVSDSKAPFVDTSAVLHQFQLLPEGTKFSKDITLTFHYDSSWLQGSSPWNIGVAYKNDADGKWYPAVNGSVDTVAHTFSIRTSHFSNWCIYTCFHLYMKKGSQFSEDGSTTINMNTGDNALLLCTMEEPPLWKEDADKSKDFSDPLIAPLVKPQIDPKEQYSKSLAPDAWTVDGVANGDEHLGIILPVNGATEQLYQYIAPPQVPENNPVTVTARINTGSHGVILILQPVEILGKWELDLHEDVVSTGPGVKMTLSTNNSVFFHIDDQNKVVFDKETHDVYKMMYDLPAGQTMTVTTDAYPEYVIDGGDYDPQTNDILCQIKYHYVDGTWTVTSCDASGCETQTTKFPTLVQASAFEGPLKLKAESPYVLHRDTTFTDGEETSSVKATFTLKNVDIH